jgi:hypothetical protein
VGNLPAKMVHRGAGGTSPPAFAALYLRSISRSLFVFCFERDPHGLHSLPLEKAKVLRLAYPLKMTTDRCREGDRWIVS